MRRDRSRADARRADGLNALKMRRIADDLEVEAMSLCNHGANKADLWSGLVDRLWGLADLAEDEPDWRAGLERLAAGDAGTT